MVSLSLPSNPPSVLAASLTALQGHKCCGPKNDILPIGIQGLLETGVRVAGHCAHESSKNGRKSRGFDDHSLDLCARRVPSPQTR